MHFILSVLFVLLVAPLIGRAEALEAGAAKAVLVTGASTGIGRKVTERLAADGYVVYATARKEDDLKALGAIKNVHPLRLDVTEPADIAAAVDAINKGGRGLYGLVNNAGVATVGTIADMSAEEFDLVMRVNAYGPVRMIKAFEPLLMAQKGRIINIGSISGILASPNLAAYSMSKHAIEALTDSLAAQLAESGVQVSVVEPGNYNSNIGKNTLARIGADSKAAVSTGYKLKADRSIYKEPDEVAVVVERALSEPTVQRRYMVVPNQDEAELTIKKQIEQLVQLNERQPYSYDRAALVKMLDDALAQLAPKGR
jgi:NAD(P)-dependent dehydrogenase (short-subunit alcohol dehydrogenase family)